jgi:hypothetical protein
MEKKPYMGHQQTNARVDDRMAMYAPGNLGMNGEIFP